MPSLWRAAAAMAADAVAAGGTSETEDAVVGGTSVTEHTAAAVRTSASEIGAAVAAGTNW